MEIKTTFLGFNDLINPFIVVSIGEYSKETEVKEDTTEPIFNQTIWLPMNLPSLVQNIKLELKSCSISSIITLAT